MNRLRRELLSLSIGAASWPLVPLSAAAADTERWATAVKFCGTKME